MTVWSIRLTMPFPRKRCTLVKNIELSEKNTSPPDSPAGLRERAEQKSKGKGRKSTKFMPDMTTGSMLENLHELQVYQIELAMQNENLRKTQLELELSRARYFDLYDRAPVGYFTLLENDRFQDANVLAKEILGLGPDEYSGCSITRFIRKDELDRWYLRSRQLFKSGEIQNFDIGMRTSAGIPFYGHLSMSMTAAGEAEPACRVVLVDVTARRELEAALALEKKLLETTLGSIGDGVISTDRNGNVVFLNRVAESLTGWLQEDARGKPVREVFHIINEFSRTVSDGFVEQILKSGKVHPLPPHTILISRKGQEYPIEDCAAPIVRENGEIVGVVLGFRDFSDKKQKQDEIKFLSYHDQLTGLYNRRFFEEELRRIDTVRNLPLTIAMGDVNGLKLINDSFGHAVGDEMLRKVADAIRKGCRDDEIVARLGGDEFVIILPKTDLAMAEKIIRRIRGYATRSKVASIDISISFGLDTKTREEEDIQEVFKRTENHMYRQKLSESSSIRSKTIVLIMNTLFEKNNREMLHSKRVGKLSADIAAGMNLNEDEVNQIRIAGMMHDIGKIGIDENILNKPMKLNTLEWKEIERHSEIGYRILSSVNEFSEIADFILENHEKWNGKGYPKGLKHGEISLQARIIAIADAFDAMTGTRTYGRPVSLTDAVLEIKRCSGTQFDPEVARVFVEKILGVVW